LILWSPQLPGSALANKLGIAYYPRHERVVIPHHDTGRTVPWPALHSRHAHSRVGHIGNAGGRLSEAEILTDFSDLEADDIRACLSYAAGLVGHPVVVAAE
jgi:hypothetical protein